MAEAIKADADAMGKRMSFDRAEDAVGGDWTCTKCGNKNFAKRSSCFSCSAAKGSGDEKAPAAINQLFKPPSYNQGAPFFQTIEKAKAEGKWVLVNVQQADAFASHTLNRDVWSDETVTDLVEENFLFWQRDNLSTEGEQFCRTYKCGGELPHICMIDPRTGRSVKSWPGSKWGKPHTAAEYIFEFMERYPAPTADAAVPPPKASAASAAPSASGAAAAAGPARVQAEAAKTPEASMGPGTVLGSGSSGSATGVAAAAAAAGDKAEETKPQGEVAQMPEEPGTDVEHLKVSFRLPSGQRVMRRFRPTDTLEMLFAVASALSSCPPDDLDVSTQMPKRSLRDIDGGMVVTVKDAKVGGNMLLVETGKRRKTE